MSKISELSDGGALQSTDYLIAVRSGGNVKVQLSELPSGIGAGGNIVFGDNEKAIFGAGSDLQIYHDGSNSWVSDQGTGQLILESGGAGVYIQKGATETMANFVADGAVSLYYDNSKKIETTATGIDVTGTVSATTALEVSSGVPYIDWTDTATTDEDTRAITFNGDFYIGTINDAKTTTKKRFLIDHSTGDISFYEDTGTTPKFFWDASAEALGLGTASPSAPLDIKNTNSASIKWQRTGVSAKEWGFVSDNDQTYLYNFTDAIVSAYFKNSGDVSITGNVGIGTSSPFANQILNTSWSAGAPYGTVLAVTGNNTNDANWGHLLITDSTTTTGSGGALRFGTGSTSGDINPFAGIDGYSEGSNYGGLKFLTRPSGGTATEAMRIDSSGNLLVGTTSAYGVGGATVTSGGLIYSSVSGNHAAEFNRNTSDGNIVNFNKDGATVGSIGAYSGGLYIGSPAGTDAFIGFTNSIVYPSTSAGVGRDAAIDLGSSGSRFKDLYLSGGVYLGGTGAANLLDDYEEGTWTPSWAGVTTAGTPTGTFTGRYTKIGNVVTVWANIAGANLTGATGILVITGLPFTPEGSASGVCYLEGVTPTYTSTTPTGAGLSVHVYTSTQLSFKPSITTSWDNYLQANSTFTGGGGSTYGWFTVTYEI